MDPSAARLPFVNAVCRFASFAAVAVLVAVGWLLRCAPSEAIAQLERPNPNPPPTTYHLPSSPWYEGFEGPDTTWRLVGGNGAYQVELHQRVRGTAHTGEGSEYVRVAGASGTEVYFAHEIGHPRVIDELLPTVWVKADRPGMQLVVQVVLPRTLDPKTQIPLSMLLQGTTYTAVGRWEQLRVEDIPRLLARKAATLRARWPRLDPQEAYVERVLLNVYGGPGTTNVWIDDLDIGGYVGPPAAKMEAAVSVPVPDWWPAPQPTTPGFLGAANPGDAAGPGRDARNPAPGAANPGTGDPPAASSTRGRIAMSGSVLSIDGRVVFPRIIQYQGEPLAALAKLGFNAVWLPQAATSALLQEARNCGLWLICPPPQGPSRDSAAGPAPPPEIGPEFDAVLAWDLGGGLGAQQLPGMRRQVEQLRNADRKQGSRPLVCRPDGELWAYSRAVSILLVGRSVAGTSLELSRYGEWLRGRPRLAIPDTALWTSIATQPAPMLREQWAALGRSNPPAAFPSEQVRLAVYAAIGAGARGLLFESYSPLTADDPDTRQRAWTLELLNLESKLVETWAAAGSPADSLSGSEPGVTAVELQAPRARLLLPTWCMAKSQFVCGQSAGRGVSFVVPGVPEADDAFDLLPGSVRPLIRKSAALGPKVTLDEFGLCSRVLLTQDPRVKTDMTARAGEIGRRAAELQRQLAADKLREVEAVSEQLRGRVASVPQAAEWLGSARASLAQCDALFAAHEHAEAYLCAERAMRPLRTLERVQWDQATAGLFSPVASPLAVCYRTLPEHVGLMQQTLRAAAGPNLLPAGDFEDIGAMYQAGWRHVEHVTQGVQCAAELSPKTAHGGRTGLRLVVQPVDPAQPPAQIESPPVWITSPAVPVPTGQLLRIQGWVHVPKPITASVDGLLIVDSLGGEPLAARLDQTPRWQQFTLYRIAPQSGPVSVTFALTGIGEAWLDDVTIQAFGR